MRKEEAIRPEEMDRCLLELASEIYTGVKGRSLRGIRQVMEARTSWDEVRDAIEILLDKKLVAVRHGDARKPLADLGTVIEVTPAGKDYLRRLVAVKQFNVRVPERLIAELAASGRQGESPSIVAVQALEEWVRMEKFPGIQFQRTASGRKPLLTGTGLSVWEVFHIWQDFDRNVDRIAKAYPYLKPGLINIAVAYAQAYGHEMPVGEWGEKPPFAREVKV